MGRLPLPQGPGVDPEFRESLTENEAADSAEDDFLDVEADPTAFSKASVSSSSNSSEPSKTSGSKGSTASSGSGSRVPLNNAKTDVIMKVETLPDSRVKSSAGLLNVALVLGTAAVLILFVLKAKRMNDLLMGEALFIWNIAVASFNLVIVSICLAFMIHRLRLARIHKKRWSRRRLMGTRLFMVELVTQLVNSIFYLLPNVYILIQDCGWFDAIIPWSGFVRFTCWNIIYTIISIQVSNQTPYVDENNEPIERFDATWMDAPITIHKWKLGPWLIFETMLLAVTFRAAYGSSWSGTQKTNPTFCKQDGFDCPLDPVILYLTMGIGCIVLGHFFYFIYKRRETRALLNTKAYTQYRLGNVFGRLNSRIRVLAYSFMTVSFGLLWFYNVNSCASYTLGWFGFLPLQFVQSVMVAVCTLFFHPVKPNQDFNLNLWLQEFSWTERELCSKKKKRGNGMCEYSTPMFCFETAMKAYYWSEFVYDYREVEKSPFNLETAMELYKLNNYEMFLEPSHDTKVLLAWSNDTVLLAFRGTKTVKNVVADLKLLRKPHPPKRNGWWSRPMTHRGFLDTWQSNGLDQRILQKMKDIIGERVFVRGGKNLQVLVTGHSLGGAVASLAAFDIARYVGVPMCCIRCYTFGAPRTGNHAFAREYNALVPDTWHIINDQDYVTRTLKFIRMYKRHGHRVIINAGGDMIVKPSFLEISVLKRWGHVNVAHHLLSSYRKSLIAVVEAQFKNDKRVEGGMSAILDLLNVKPMSSPSNLAKVLGVDRASLVRLSVYGSRLKDLSKKQKRRARRERLEQVSSALRNRGSMIGGSMLEKIRSFGPMSKSQVMECDGMCPESTMACGRKICHDMTPCRKTGADLRCESGFICPVSHMPHVTFGGVEGSIPDDHAFHDVENQFSVAQEQKLPSRGQPFRDSAIDMREVPLSIPEETSVDVGEGEI
ncbi:hypothetical protein BSKO_14070 [Bryopsis sp. KO-2023]|nr:hypothetical protein BSKO_14070 [Bryopsis sp. KO-2023]